MHTLCEKLNNTLSERIKIHLDALTSFQCSEIVVGNGQGVQEGQICRVSDPNYYLLPGRGLRRDLNVQYAILIATKEPQNDTSFTVMLAMICAPDDLVQN